MSGFSLIVCTHNPDSAVFSVVRESLVKLAKNTAADLEILVVDNNSSKPLAADHELTEQFKDVVDFRVIREERPGLTHARIAGYHNARHEWLVFVDDDNVPNDNYINELQRLGVAAPQVKCWGAGRIIVEYVDTKETPFLRSIRTLFQERDLAGVSFSCNRKGEAFYPPGSSLCVHTDVFRQYHKMVSNGIITAGDRTGNSLNSAGDAQIIYCSIKDNFAVGSSAGLQLKHLISKTKTRFSYLMRLVYALNSCHVKAYNEVFTDDPIPVRPASNGELWRAIYSQFRRNGITSAVRMNLLDISRIMGMFNAGHLAGNFRKPFTLRIFETVIGHQ